MRKILMLLLFALFAAAMIAQTPAGTTTPPAQTQQNAPAAQARARGEDTQRATTPANASPGANQAQQASPAAGAPSAGQSSSPNQIAVNDQVSAGTEIRATLDAPLSTRISKPGDRFTATISEPVRGTNGGTVIPAGTRVEGEVAEMDEAKALPALRDKPNLSLRFRDVVLPNGQSLPLTATLISVNNINGKNAKKSDSEVRIQSGGRDVAGNNGNAATGSTAGPVFGGPLKGLAIGAMPGGAYVLSTKGKDVNLPAQTGMVIRLDQPVSSSAASIAAPPQ